MPEPCLVLQEQVNEYRSLVQREDYTTAADLLVQLAAPLLTGGQARRFLDLLEAIPEPILHRHRDLLIAAGNAWLLCDNWQHAGNCYRQAQELTDIAGDALTAGRIFTSRGLVCWRRGDIAGALRWYDQALQALDGVAEAHPVRAELDSNYALAFSSLGALHDAEPILQRQLRMFQRNADANGERMTLHNLGMMIAVRRGDFQAAETLLREALRIAQEHALRYGELYVANSLAYALIWQGKAAEALALSLHAQALGEELGTPNPLAFALLNRAAALLQQGNHPGAERACTQARAQLDSALSAPLHCDILLVQAQLQQVHCTAQAYQTAQQALRAAHGDRWMLDQAQLHVASLALDLTRSAEAQAALNEAGLIFQDFADRYHLLRWAVLAARLAHAQHDWPALADHVSALLAGLAQYPALLATTSSTLADLLAAALEHDPDRRDALQQVARQHTSVIKPLAPALLGNRSAAVQVWTIAAVGSCQQPWAWALLADHADPQPAVQAAVQTALAPVAHAPLPNLQLRCLGRFAVAWDQIPIPAARWHSIYAQLVLAYLALRGVASRDELIELLWPDDDLAKTDTRLRATLKRLRQTLCPPWQAKADYVLHCNKQYCLNQSVQVASDVQQFQDWVNLAKSQAAPARYNACTQALAYYSGDFLPGRYEDWVLAERDRLHADWLWVQHEDAQGLILAGKLAVAEARARQLMRSDPDNEPACRLLMGLLHRQDRSAEAVIAYQTFAARLKAQFGLEPCAKTQQLFASISQIPFQERSVG